MMKYLWFKIGILLSIIPMAFATNSEAQESSQALNNTLFSKVHPFLKFSAGMISAKIGQPQSFSPDNTCYYNYSPTQNKTQRLLLGGALGAELALPYPFSALDLGVSYYNAKFPSQGLLTQGADVISFDSYRYSYAVRTQQVLVEGQLFLMLRQFILPYFYAGIGEAFNRAMSYQTNVNPWLQFTPQYQNKKNASLSYAVGGGVDFKLKNTGLRLGLGYRFSDLGKANLGKGNIDTASLPFTLKQAHLFTNQVIFQLTYLF